MSKAAEYRANAEECQRMAGLARNPTEKATWLQIAEHWLRMIPGTVGAASERFHMEERSKGTQQSRSEAKH